MSHERLWGLFVHTLWLWLGMLRTQTTLFVFASPGLGSPRECIFQAPHQHPVGERWSPGSGFGCPVTRPSERVAVAAGLPKDPRGSCCCVLLNQAYLTDPCQMLQRVVLLVPGWYETGCGGLQALWATCKAEALRLARVAEETVQKGEGLAQSHTACWAGV